MAASDMNYILVLKYQEKKFLIMILGNSEVGNIDIGCDLQNLQHY